MRVSHLGLNTLRDVPSNAEIASHRLLLRGGFIRRISGGIYAYMPLLWKVIKKITNIIEEELEIINCNQTLLPQLHPSELWLKSGRWKNYTEGEGIMFNLKDRQDKEFGLAPTHEEVITNVAAETINSYKQLPISFFQIQTKFRDEIRPRFGLMRSREFIMKDAYSFHANKKDLQIFYSKVKSSYETIFKKCGLRTVSVDADSGAIGDGASREFMVIAESGEDTILTTQSGDYAANIEKAISIPSEAIPLKKAKEELIKTPSQKKILQLCESHALHASQLIKVLLFIAEDASNHKTLVLTCLRGDHEINETKLFNIIASKKIDNIISIRTLEEEDFKKEKIQSIPLGFIGPDLDENLLIESNLSNKMIRIVDTSALELESFVCGANEIGFHKFFSNWNSLKISHETGDIRNASEEDFSINEKGEKQKLFKKKGIEVGHIFQLGQKYSTCLNASFTNESGSLEYLWMGCYGIGITRLAQAAIEQNHDENGIYWPVSIAPFEVIIVTANNQDELQKKMSEEIYNELKELKVDVLLDDRNERAGVKFKDADLIGIPLRITIGRNASKGKIEVLIRYTKELKEINSNDVKKEILNQLKKMHDIDYYD
tara:strand:- start:5867 stop:7675 length:1809 start_codon:yes stop_codon:yes gene_type:complete